MTEIGLPTFRDLWADHCARISPPPPPVDEQTCSCEQCSGTHTIADLRGIDGPLLREYFCPSVDAAPLIRVYVDNDNTFSWWINLDDCSGFH